MRRRRANALIAVTMVALVMCSALAVLSDNSGSSPSADNNVQNITYRPNGASGSEYTATYYGIASTEYNPLYWNSSTRQGNWSAPDATEYTVTMTATTTLSIAGRGSTSLSVTAAGWDIGSITASTSSGSLTTSVSQSGDTYTINISNTTNTRVRNPSLTLSVTVDSIAAIDKCFAGWRSPEGTVYLPGDVVPDDVTSLDAVWVNPYNITASGAMTVSNTRITLPTLQYNNARCTITNNGPSTSGTVLHTTETPTMFNTLYALTGSSTINGNVPVGSYRSNNIANPVTITINAARLTGDAIFDNIILTASATGDGTTHGDGTTSGIWGQGHVLILGNDIAFPNGVNNRYKAPQIFGGYNASTNITTPAVSGKEIVSRTLEPFTVNLGTCVIIHSGYYYNIVAGSFSGTRGNIGSAGNYLSTYLVMKGGCVLDTVMGASGGSGSSNTVYGSAGSNFNDPKQGGTFIYALGCEMPGDYWEETNLGYTSKDYMRFRLTESTILEGAGSSTNSTVNGCAHVFISDKASVYDAQAGPRRPYATVSCTFMEVSGHATVKHVACGTVTDGNNNTGDTNSVRGVTFNVTDDPKIAYVFGAGYDTFYKANYTTMSQGNINVNISGGEIGAVYGGGYRGYVGTTSTDVNITVNISGGHILDNVYGGGRGGVDKICHNNDGSDNWGESDTDSTGKSYVYGSTTVNITGGTIDGSVYGGGESVPKLSRYTGFNETFVSAPNDVAAVYGNTTVNVSGGTIGGSVFGAGKGITADQFNANGTSKTYEKDHTTVPYFDSTNFTIDASGNLFKLEWMTSQQAVSTYDTNIDYTQYAKVTGTSTVNITGGSIGENVYGGGAYGTAGYASVTMSGGDATDIYGGGYGVLGTTSISGNSSASISSNASVGGSVFGGCAYGKTDGSSSASVSGGTVADSVYGGGLGDSTYESVGGNSQVTVSGGTVARNVYGGCAYGVTTGTSSVTITGGMVGIDAYAGGLGRLGYVSVKGKRYLTINGGTVDGSAYGGSSLGNDASSDAAAALETPEENCSATVVVTKGTISGSIYGGGYKGKTTGSAYIYVGYSEPGVKSVGNIISVGNSIYAGGDVGELGPTDVPFEDTMVFGKGEVYFNGNNNVTFTGTVSAAGNSCKTGGATLVEIVDLRLDNYIESVQRADVVNIVTSELKLSGKVSGAVGDNTKYAFFGVGTLNLKGGSTIHIYAPLGVVGQYRSLNAEGSVTRSTSPMNRLNICNGTMFEVRSEDGEGNIVYGNVSGYTILSILTIEGYYGAVTFGEKNSPGGFVVEKDGSYVAADHTDFTDCRCWFISGVLQTVSSSTLRYDSDAGSYISDGGQYVIIPTLSRTTQLRYTGGFFTSENYTISDSESPVSGVFGVKVGTNTKSNPDALVLENQDGTVGRFLPQVYDTTCQVMITTRTEQPVMEVTVYGHNDNMNAYLGYATIFLQEVVPVEYTGPDGTPVTEYIVQNKIEVKIDMYMEGLGTDISDSTAVIRTVNGTGTTDVILPSRLNDCSIYLTGVSPAAPSGVTMSVATVKNNGGTTGWNSPLRSIDVSLGYSGSPALMQTLTGAYLATLRFSVENFAYSGTHVSTFTFEVRDPSGNNLEYFEVELSVMKHPPVIVNFHDPVVGDHPTYSFDYGSTITVNDCPNTGDNFVGWYTDDKYNNEYNFNIPLTTDLDLYASYKYTVTFNNMNGTESTMYVDPAGSGIIRAPDNPTWDGYIFRGWYKEQECLSPWHFNTDTVTGDMTLYAKWEGVAYYVTFMYKTTGDMQQLYYQGEPYTIDVHFGNPYGGGISEATSIIRDIVGDNPLYRFVRWQLTTDSTSTGIYDDTICSPPLETNYDPARDMNYYPLYAEFTAEAINIVLDRNTTDENARISAPTDYLLYPDNGLYTFVGNEATRNGYRISGWSMYSDGRNPVPSGSDWTFYASDIPSPLLVDNTLIMYALWERIEYTITIVQHAGGTITVYKNGVGYEDSLTAYYMDVLTLNFATDDGYAFTRWNINGQGTPVSPTSISTTMDVKGNAAIYVQLKSLETVTVRLALDGGQSPTPDTVNLYLSEDLTTEYVRFARTSIEEEDGIYYGVYSVSSKLGSFYIVAKGTTGTHYYLGEVMVGSEPPTVTISAVSITNNVTGAAMNLPEYALPENTVDIEIPEFYEVYGHLYITVNGDTTELNTDSFTVPATPTSGMTISGTLVLVKHTVDLHPDSGFICKVDDTVVTSLTIEHGSPIGTFPDIYGPDGEKVGTQESGYTLGGWFYDEDFSEEALPGDEVLGDTDLYPQVVEKSSIQYTVRIFQMGLDGLYPVDPTYVIRPVAKDGQTTTYTPPTYTGLTLITDPGVYTDFTPHADTILNLYYNRLSSSNPVISIGTGTASLAGWTFVAGNPNTLTKSTVYYGENITLPAVTLTGYTHSGWLVNGQALQGNVLPVTTIVDGSLVFPTVSAVLTINSYNLVLNTPISTFTNGSTTKTVSVVYGTVISVAVGFEYPIDIDHYEFDYWSDGANEFDIDSPMPADRLVLTAVWITETYTLTFSGDEHTHISATSGSTPISSGDSVPYGTVNFSIRFDAHYTYLNHSVVGSEQTSFNHTDRQNYTLSILLLDDTVVTFTSQVSQYLVRYVINGNYDPNLDQSCTEGTDVYPVDYQKTGYDFDGWYSDIDYTEPITVIPSIVRDWVLYGQVTPIEYTVSFNGNGGTGSMTPVTLTYDSPRALPANTFVKSGSDFIGWATSSETGVAYADAETVTNISLTDITLYAVWLTPVSYSGTYDAAEHSATVTAVGTAVFYSETELNADNYETGSLDPLVYTDSGVHTVYFFAKATKVAYPGSVTVTITPVSVTIVMDPASKNAGESDPAFTGTVTCDISTAVLSITFIRSNAGVEDPGVYDDVITASYTANMNYTVTITPADFTIFGYDTVYYRIVGGGGGAADRIESESVIRGTPFTPKTATPNDGYSFYEWIRATFVGDSIVSATHVTYSRTLDSEDIEPGTYMAFFLAGDSITYNANGGTGSMAVQTFTDRSGSLTPNAFTKNGYIFAGWSTNSDGTGPIIYDRAPLTRISVLHADDALNVLYAVWKPYSYTSEIIWTVDGNMISADGSFLRTDSEGHYAIIHGDRTASISASWLSALADPSRHMGLLVELDYGTILFDASCVSTFVAAGKAITFSVKPVAQTSAETFNVTNGDNVAVRYNITASYIDNNGVKQFIHSLGGTATVTVVNISGYNSVVYVGDDGSQPIIVSYTADTITFTTDHFSLYEIVDEPVILEETESPEMVYSLLMFAAFATIIAAIISHAARRE